MHLIDVVSIAETIATKDFKTDIVDRVDHVIGSQMNEELPVISEKEPGE
ncbi:hypothetical protein N9Z14_01770 [Opitutales bacterium]|nr:hypothetical protein [Opitutales bacterium]